MAFVNEYVSDEDIRKYGLEEVRKKWSCDIPPGFRYTWTIDRERDCYFIPLRSGREEFANRKRCVCYFRGVHWDIEVAKEPGTSISFRENPYRVTWGLVGIKNTNWANLPSEDLIPILKEALTAFGADGVFLQAPNTITEFTF